MSAVRVKNSGKWRSHFSFFMDGKMNEERAGAFVPSSEKFKPSVEMGKARPLLIKRREMPPNDV